MLPLESVKENDPTILSLYNNGDHLSIIDRLFSVSDTDDPLPLSDMLSILSDNRAPALVTILTHTLIRRVNDVDQALMNEYTMANDHLKRAIIQTIGYSNRSVCMEFLLTDYFRSPHMRPVIRELGFQNKHQLLLSLIRYVESMPFTRTTVEVTQQILRTIPPSLITRMGTWVSGTTLMDIYYATPPRVTRDPDAID